MLSNNSSTIYTENISRMSDMANPRFNMRQAMHESGKKIQKLHVGSSSAGHEDSVQN